MMAKNAPVLSAPIAYITGEYPRATDTFIQREVFALRKLGMKVLTCSIRKTGAEHLVGDEQRTEAKSTFYVLRAAKSPLRLIACHVRTLFKTPHKYLSTLALALGTGSSGFKGRFYQLFYFAEAVILADHLKRNGVVHLHNHIATASCSVAMLASNVSGIPFSFTLHGPDIFFEPQRWRLDAKIKRAQFVACISDFCRNKAKEFSDPDCWDKLHIVHCGVEPARYVQQTPTDNSIPQLTFVGRLATVKGIPVLFEALSKVSTELSVTLIGDGPERAELESQARAFGLSHIVKFAGYKSQSEVADALRKTDVFVLPSFAEGVPVVLMEAMAARVPVIATRIAGIPELVEHGVSGLLVSPNDADALAHAIFELVNDPKRRVEMGQAGREKVLAAFNIEHEAAWLAQVFQAYCLGRPKPETRPENMGGRNV